jgi:hypothetical protein
MNRMNTLVCVAAIASLGACFSACSRAAVDVAAGEHRDHGAQAHDDAGASELERLAFIPPGECVFSARLVCGNLQALLVDRFEVTRAQWRAWYEHSAPEKTADEDEQIASWTPDTDRWPATFLSLVEARAYAAARDMRLLTSREWIRVASGTNLQPWPWGPSAASAVSNTLELHLMRPVAVGTFEQGKTPQSVYDMIGNAWEWVDAPLSWSGAESSPALEWALGGSYLSKLRPLWDVDFDGHWTFNQRELDARTRASDIGLRCAADAKTYLWEHRRQWGASPAAHERLASVGRAWGRDAVPLLDELSTRADSAPGLTWLLEGARR